MGKPYKKIERYLYTEIVYYNSSGNEVDRDRQYDDSWFDTLGTENLTEDEIADWIEED